ncbi:MAG TPA: FGGY family carbohydrate kinase [Pontiellaceae bacterium]|nr:FGGY family carbohydrate kinase [Pontiellaceae bacterium]HPR82238.1 FGGY family carbohydrate kinase [Pontiellaceae bacterium]
MAEYILSIDLGTTSCKAVLFDTDFNIVTTARREYKTSYPHAGWAEQPAYQWWEALRENTKAVLKQSAVDPAKIIAVGIDAFSTTVLPVDKAGDPLRPGLIWMDRRSGKQSDWIAKNLGKELWEINGNVSDAGNIAPKIMWIKENEPEVYKKTHMFLHANGYLVYCLTGKYSMDISEAGLSQLCNTATGQYSDELINACGIDRAKLPPIFNCTDVVGKVTAEAAAKTGLVAGTPVIAGSMDNVAAGLGAGVSKGGEVFISGGTVTTNNVCLSVPKYNRNLHIYPHIVPGTWITAGGVDFGGAGLKWFKELLEVENYAEIDALADTSVCAKSSVIFLPYMVGQRCPIWNDHTTGVLIGLKPTTNRQDLVRAFMEGTTYGSRHVLSLVQDEGVAIENVKITGGSANSAAWVQIFSDVIGKPIDIPGAVDLPPLGVAIAAAYGVGAIKTFDEGIAKIAIRESFVPDEENHAYYTEMYGVFRSLYENIKGEYDRLAAIERKFKK